MHKFRFRLQSILDLRRHEEEQRRIELGAITSRCTAIRNEISERQERRRAVLAVRPPGVESDEIEWRGAAAAYALRLEHEAQHLSKQLTQAESERSASAQRYRDVKQKADVLEKLRERRYLAYRKDVKREEQNRLDEVSQQLHRQGGQK